MSAFISENGGTPTNNEKTKNTNRKIYMKINELGFDSFSIVLVEVEEYSECQNIGQLRKKEREAI